MNMLRKELFLNKQKERLCMPANGLGRIAEISQSQHSPGKYGSGSDFLEGRRASRCDPVTPEHC